MAHFVERAPTDASRFGNKAALLTEAARLGAPVPPSFTISREIGEILRRKEALPLVAEQEIEEALRALEQETGLRLGDPAAPLLVSVRSGAEVSMPGMLDTILDVGLSPDVLIGLGARYDKRLAEEAELQLLRTFGEATVPEGRPDALSPFQVAAARSRASSTAPSIPPEEHGRQTLKESILGVYAVHQLPLPPREPKEQLMAAIRAVFASWDRQRARDYRHAEARVDDAFGTAVTVMAMVFGNADAMSGAGVLVTRDPNTGGPALFGEHLVSAQGDALATGRATPDPFSRAQDPALEARSLEARWPEAYQRLSAQARTLEAAFRIPLEIEFTVERGVPWVLQVRAAKLSPAAEVRAAVEMLEAGQIDAKEAIARVEPKDLEPLLTPTVDPARGRILIAKGLAASAGAATGAVVFSAAEAEARSRRDEAVILVRPDTSPDDVRGIRAARGVITGRGGTTSHAAVVARSLGKVCVVGARELAFDLAKKQLVSRGHVVREGDVLTVDGESGEIFLGRLATKAKERGPEVDALLEVADRLSSIEVMALVRSEEELKLAIQLGAKACFAVLSSPTAQAGASRTEVEAMIRAADRRPLIIATGRLEGPSAESRPGPEPVLGGSNPPAGPRSLRSLAMIQELQQATPSLRWAFELPLPAGVVDADARAASIPRPEVWASLSGHARRVFLHAHATDERALAEACQAARAAGIAVGLVLEDRVDSVDLPKLIRLGVRAVVVKPASVAVARLAAAHAAL